MKTITIHLDKPHQVIDESQENFESQTFQSVYSKAREELTAITAQLRNFRDQHPNESSEISQCPNNVLAFTGDRGTGKTSSMTTFISMIRRGDDEEYKSLKEQIHFFNLLDPSSFQPSHSIIGALIGILFDNYSEKAQKVENNEKVQNNQYQQLEDELIKKFQNVLIDIQTVNLIKNPLGDPRDPDNPFYTLSRLASSTKLKNNFSELIKTYLEYINLLSNYNTQKTAENQSQKKQFVALCIDDLDLNVSSVFCIIEELRKHLSIPNLIILCSLRIEQISHAISEHYLNNLRSSFQKTSESQMMAEVEEMTEFYIEKVFPASRNIEMPPLLTRTWLRDPNCKIVLKGDETITFGNSDKTKNTEHELLEYISSKVGILFLPKDNHIHPIIPKTIRLFANFINFIEKLDGNKTNSLRTFYDYFLSQYPRLHLPYNYETKLKYFMEASLEYRNKFIINKWETLFPMSSKYCQDQLNIKDSDIFPKYKELSKRQKLPKEKAHLSDVVEILLLIEELDINEAETTLAFIIKTLTTLNIQIEFNSNNKQLLNSLIGESLLHPKFTRRILQIEDTERAKLGADALLIKHKLTPPINITLCLQCFVFPTIDSRWSSDSVRTLFEAHFDIADYLTLDPFFTPIWYLNRSRFYEYFIVEDNQKKIDVEENSISLFGKSENWKIFYNLELLELLYQNLPYQIRITKKNRLVIDAFEGSDLADRIAVFVKSVEQLLVQLNFRFEDTHLHDHFNRIPIYQTLSEYKTRKEEQVIIKANKINSIFDPSKELHKKSENNSENETILIQNSEDNELQKYLDSFRHFRISDSKRIQVFKTVSSFLIRYHDKIQSDELTAARNLLSKYEENKSLSNKEKLLDWCFNQIKLLAQS